MGYRERPGPVPGVVVWTRRVDASPQPNRILPDGCLDLIWNGSTLFVAGPDTSARWHTSQPGASYVALRCAGGVGPALVGVPAHAVVDESPELSDVWPAGAARTLAERVAERPAALAEWALQRARSCQIDPVGPTVLRLAADGAAVSSMAERLGLSSRQLHRRCLDSFGFGPRRLIRVLRFDRALRAARAGVPFAQVAADAGYSDQAHLARDSQNLAHTTVTSLVAGR